MKLNLVCKVVFLLVIFSNNIIFSTAELPNSIIFNENMTETSIWETEEEEGKSIEISYESIGIGKVNVSITYFGKPHHSFLISPGDMGGHASPNILSVSLFLRTDLGSNHNVTIYWEIKEITLTRTAPQSNSNFFNNIDLNSIISAGGIFIGIGLLIALMIISYYFGYKRKNQ